MFNKLLNYSKKSCLAKDMKVREPAVSFLAWSPWEYYYAEHVENEENRHVSRIMEQWRVKNNERMSIVTVTSTEVTLYRTLSWTLFIWVNDLKGQFKNLQNCAYPSWWDIWTLSFDFPFNRQYHLLFVERF